MDEDTRELEDVEIAPLSDEDLEDVAGGAIEGSSNSCCSCSACSDINREGTTVDDN